MAPTWGILGGSGTGGRPQKIRSKHCKNYTVSIDPTKIIRANQFLKKLKKPQKNFTIARPVEPGFTKKRTEPTNCAAPQKGVENERAHLMLSTLLVSIFTNGLHDGVKYVYEARLEKKYDF